MRKLVKRLFRWIFEEELNKVQRTIIKYERELEKCEYKDRRLGNILENIDISVDHNPHSNYRSRSWACISIQGKREDFVKFVDLGDRDIREIQYFLRRFDRGNVDTSPNMRGMFKFERRRGG